MEQKKAPLLYQAQKHIHMNHVDSTGIIFHPQLFTLCQETLEAFCEAQQLSISGLVRRGTFSVVVHCEADFFLPIRLGDKIAITLHTEKVGNTSFALRYQFHPLSKKEDGRGEDRALPDGSPVELLKTSTVAASAKLVHVMTGLDGTTKPVPEAWRKILSPKESGLAALRQS